MLPNLDRYMANMDIWDLNTFKRFQLPHSDHPEEGHEAAVYTIQLQGDHLVSGSADKSVRIWNIKDQRLAAPPLLGHEASVLCLQFDASPGEDTIISGGVDAAVIVWQFSTGEIIRKLTDAHDESVLSLAWDDRYLITGGKDKLVKIWIRHTVSAQDELVPRFVRSAPPIMDEDLMITEYSHLATLSRHYAAVNTVQLSGDKIASGSGDRVLYIWNLQSGEVTHTFNMHKKGIACLWLNSRFAVTGSSDRTVRMIDLEQRRELACLEGYTNLVRSVQVTEGATGEPSHIVTGSYDGFVKFWTRDSSSESFELKADLKYGSLQPLPQVDEAANTLFPSGSPSRAFKIQAGEGRLFCSGNGRIIEGWEFEMKTPKE